MVERARPQQHPVLDPPKEVREIAATLERAGFETWCVGGAVRDALLGLPHLDWDLATAATPTEVKRLFKRTIPVGEQFGTIGVLDRHGRMHEVTTFRHDVRTDGRHAAVEFGASLDEDLARRDFTINAIAFSPKNGALHDPFRGRDDLARGVVRSVGVAGERMVEDRLRALRALRFAGRFGFRIESATWSAIIDSAPHLLRLSKERVKQELEKTMEQVQHPSAAMELWRASGALGELLPRLAGGPSSSLGSADFLARPDDTRDPGRKRRRTLVRLATLFVGLTHDAVRHDVRSLRFSNRDIEWLTQLAVAATVLGPMVRERLLGAGRDMVRGAVREELSAAVREEVPGAVHGADAELRRWAAVTGRARLADTLRVALATLHEPSDRVIGARERARALYRRALIVAYRDPVEIADLAVDGEDLMRDGGVPRGPMLGEVLRRLRDEVLEDPSLNESTRLIARAGALVAEAR
ncbi:MAG: hypothetical protein Q8K82_21300 [Gemmatimonadaceae bacterium]|nr:hypothetical protein [Gemmatimonadaceae bacterium]